MFWQVINAKNAVPNPGEVGESMQDLCPKPKQLHSRNCPPYKDVTVLNQTWGITFHNWKIYWVNLYNL